jgi:hypothetical protein
MTGSPAPRSLSILAEAAAPQAAGLGPLLRAELAAAFGRRHVIVLLGIALMGAAVAFWLPLFPDSVFRFFERVLALHGWPAIVVGNDLAGLVYFVYWLAVFDALAIVVVPLEEGYLGLLLAKPLTRRAYMVARAVPAIAAAAVVGVLGAAGLWLALDLAGHAYDPRAYAGAASATVAWAVCLASLANLLIVAARETFTALLIAFVPFFVSVMPGMLFIYRPDVYEGAPLLRDILVFPMSLVWYPGIAAAWGLAIAAALLLLTAAFVALAGARLERRDAE